MFSRGETVQDTEGKVWTVFDLHHIVDLANKDVRKIILAFDDKGEVKAFSETQLARKED